MANIPVSGVPSSDRVPGTYLDLVFNQGPSTAGAGVREAVLVMPMLSSGASWQANQLVSFRTEQDLIDGAGAGSPLHRAGRMYLKANKNNKVFALPYLPSSGGSPVAADGYVVFANAATGQGQVKLTICGEDIVVAINTLDAPVTTATNLAAAVNARTWLPVTASVNSLKCVLTAKIVGASQGDGTIPVIRYRVSITSGIGTTATAAGSALGLGAGAHAGVDGSIAESVNLQSALAVIANVRKYYIGVSVCDSTTLPMLTSHISSKSEATPGLRSVGIAAFTGTLSAAQTLAIARNYERLQIVFQPNSEHDWAELVGQMVAIRQKYEEINPVYNFDFFNGQDWFIKSVYSTSDVMDHSVLADAIEDGLTPIQSDTFGSFLVTSCTTRTKDATGSVDDFRSSETHRVSGADFISDTILNDTITRYKGFKLRDDKKNADGSVDLSQKIGPQVVTPFKFAKFLALELDKFGPPPTGIELLQDLDASKASIATDIDPQNNGRIESGVDIAIVDLAHQFTIRVAETSAG